MYNQVEVIYNNAAKEGAAILQRWFVNNNLCPLCLNALHNALNAALTEVVGVRFHRQAIYADNRLMAFLLRIIFSVRFIAAGNLQHAVSDEVLTHSVAFINCFDDVFRNICGAAMMTKSASL